MRGLSKARRLAAAVAMLAVGCVALIAFSARAGGGRAELVYKQMSMQEAIAAAKKLQRNNAVSDSLTVSAYTAQPKIQSKHAHHRAEAKAVASAADAQAAAPARPADYARGLVVEPGHTQWDSVPAASAQSYSSADGGGMKSYSSADAVGFAEMEKKVTSETDKEATSAIKRVAAQPRPADYARGLVVEPGHTQWDRMPAAVAPSQISSAAAKAQMYDNDQGVKVVTGTEGDDVASGVGGSVGGQEWVRQRQARIAAARLRTEGHDAPAAHQKAPAAHQKGKNIAKQHPHTSQTPRRRAPAASRAAPVAPQQAPGTGPFSNFAVDARPLNYDINYDNDAGVKQVEGTQGDGVASGMGGGIDGAKWVAARKSRIEGQGGVESPFGPEEVGANTLKGEVAYPGDQSAFFNRMQPTSEDIARNVGTNIVFHSVKNEGGIPDSAFN
jgi:hypothetical protein